MGARPYLVLMAAMALVASFALAGGTASAQQRSVLADHGHTISASPASQSSGPSYLSSPRWIEIDRTDQVAYAIQDNRVVYSANVTVGTSSFPTPLGTFYIQRRVYDETMDSRTIGIDRDGRDGYYLENVYFTQYFSGAGYAIHYDYWSPRNAFGNYPGSHGCVGMEWADAQFFWSFATVGTPVVIHA